MVEGALARLEETDLAGDAVTAWDTMALVVTAVDTMALVVAQASMAMAMASMAPRAV
jgi:hypothetical protein